MLVVTPYYSRPQQTGLIAHFTAVADATELPVMLYDIPPRSVVAIEPDTLLRLAEHPRITAVKDAKGDLYDGSKVIANSDLTYYSGDDLLTLPWLAIGARRHRLDHLARRRSARAGDGRRRPWPATTPPPARIHEALLPAHRAQSRTGGGAGLVFVKNALRQAGFDVGDPRLPQVPATREQAAQIADDLAEPSLALVRPGGPYRQDQRSHERSGMTANPLAPRPAPARGTLRIVALGGIGEIGRNMTVYELDGRLLIVDCGVLFPEDAQPGVDLILPDLRLVEYRVEDIDAVVVTHGHEDHIGALPWLLRLRRDIPVIGARFSLALIAAKCREHRITPGPAGGHRGPTPPGRRVRPGVLRGQPLHPGRDGGGHPHLGRHRAAHRRHQARPAAAGRPAHRPRRLRPAR